MVLICSNEIQHELSWVYYPCQTVVSAVSVSIAPEMSKTLELKIKKKISWSFQPVVGSRMVYVLNELHVLAYQIDTLLALIFVYFFIFFFFLVLQWVKIRLG